MNTETAARQDPAYHAEERARAHRSAQEILLCIALPESANLRSCCCNVHSCSSNLLAIF